MIIDKKWYTCYKCGHKWVLGESLPKSCPECKTWFNQVSPQEKAIKINGEKMKLARAYVAKTDKSCTKLKRMTKKNLIQYLIPLIADAVRINDCWINGNEGTNPDDPLFDEMEQISRTWAALRNLHDDFWK